MIKRYWIVGLIVLVVILGGLFWYLNIEKLTNLPEKIDLKTEEQKPLAEVNSWKEFSDGEIGISFKYPIIWGEPKVLKEGDIHYVNEYDKSNVLVSKGRFIINFPKSHPSVEIEGFNNDFTTGDSIEDKFSEYIYCALYNLKNKDYEVGKKLKSGSTLVYSANRREAENRIGLFGDIILNYSKGKYPSICATMSLGNDRNFLEKVFSEQKSTYNQKPFFDLILTSDYLKGLNTATKEAVENFEKFAELLKTIN